MADLVKTNDLDFAVQLNTFKNALPTYAALFGLTPMQVASVAADAEWMLYVVGIYNAVPAYAQDWTKFKAQVRKGGDGSIIPPFPAAPDVSMPPMVSIEPNIEGRFRMLVGQIKAHSNYSKAIGENLKIEADETSFDAENYKPEGSAKAVQNVVTIKFSKNGVDAIAVYSKVTAGATETNAAPPAPGTPGALGAPGVPNKKAAEPMVKLAVVSHSPFVDNRPLAVAGQPEVREYYLRGVLRDVEIGVPSNYIRVTVSE